MSAALGASATGRATARGRGVAGRTGGACRCCAGDAGAPGLVSVLGALEGGGDGAYDGAAVGPFGGSDAFRGDGEPGLAKRREGFCMQTFVVLGREGQMGMSGDRETSGCHGAAWNGCVAKEVAGFVWRVAGRIIVRFAGGGAIRCFAP